MAAFSTGSQELLTAGQDIVNTGGEIDAILRSLNGIIDSIGNTWQGEAKNAFMKLNERFDADAVKLNTALKDMADQMTGGAQLYIQQQEEQAAEMSAVTNRLMG